MRLGKNGDSAGAPQSLRDSEAGEVVVDFFQNDDQVGKLYIRTQTAESDLVRFFIEVPHIGGQDYRLDAVKFEFVSDVIHR